MPEPVSTPCPQPPPGLLLREPPLEASQSLKAPLPQREAVALWLTDISRYEILRERHTDLQQWVLKQCLGELPKKGDTLTD